MDEMILKTLTELNPACMTEDTKLSHSALIEKYISDIQQSHESMKKYKAELIRLYVIVRDHYAKSWLEKKTINEYIAFLNKKL